MANEFKVRKGLIVQGSGSIILDIQGSQGELFSVTDSLVGSLFSVNDISGIPIMEVFSDNTIKMGTFNQEAIIVSGSRTGMGIATPQAELHISGANNDSLFRIQSPAAASIMFVSGSGNVGIGTLTPTNTLNVNGTTFLQGGQTTVRGSGATSATTALRVENSSVAARLTILDDGTSAFNTNHLYVSSSGNIGIGLTAMTAKLHVSGANADALFRVSSPSATNALFVTGSGRVGIGTTNPRAALHISAGDITLDGTRYLDWANGDNRIIGGSAGGYSLQFQTWTGAALTEKMRISGSGEVGIGLTAMTARLHVSGASNAGLFEIDSPTINNIIYVSGSGNVGIGTNLPSADLHISGASADSLLLVGSPTLATTLFVTGSGRVGVGTSTPSQLFEVVRSGNSKIVAGDNVGIQTATASEWIHLSSDPSTSKYLRIDATQTSNGPQQSVVPGTFNYVAGPGTDDAVLGLPNYWMEIKLDGNIVLIPCYVPQ